MRPEVYERHRALVRAEPLLVAWGRLERRERTINVLVHAWSGPRSRTSALADVGEAPRVRAAAPEAQSFGRGRR